MKTPKKNLLHIYIYAHIRPMRRRNVKRRKTRKKIEICSECPYVKRRILFSSIRVHRGKRYIYIRIQMYIYIYKYALYIYTYGVFCCLYLFIRLFCFISSKKKCILVSVCVCSIVFLTVGVISFLMPHTHIVTK